MQLKRQSAEAWQNEKHYSKENNTSENPIQRRGIFKSVDHARYEGRVTTFVVCVVFSLRACSHEPGTVNYPGASVTSRSHDDLLSRGNVAPGQVQRHLITTNLSESLQFLYRLLQRMNFKHFCLFLVLSGTFLWEIYSKQ